MADSDESIQSESFEMATSDSFYKGYDDDEENNSSDDKLLSYKSNNIILKNPSNDEDTLYSDDYYNDSEVDSYSNDFDDSSMSNIIPIPQTMNKAIVGTINKNNIKNNSIIANVDESKGTQPYISTDMKPSIASYEAVQVELALDEISKEVLRLKNQQRMNLKHRRQEARDKKMRAEFRRLQYQQEISDYQKQISSYETTIKQLSNEIENLKSSHESLRLDYNNALQSKELLEVELQQSKLEVSSLLESKLLLVNDIENERQSIEIDRQLMKEDIEFVEKENLKLKLLTEIVNKSFETNETR